MNIRQAKKILFSSKSWRRYCKLVRPMYYDEKRKMWIQPSMHNIPNRTFQKARHKYYGTMHKYYNRHGHNYKENLL